MDQKPVAPKIDPRLFGFLMMGSFIFFQLILLLILKFVIAPDHQPSWNGFLTAVRSNQVDKVLVIFAGAVILVQQALKSRFLEGAVITLPQLVILLALAEFPGLLGFVGAISGGGNVSFALPLILLSIFSFITLKPVLLKLKT